MNYRPGPPPDAAPDPRRLLFTSGPRLGWAFRDRRELASPYPQPRPAPQVVQARAAARLQAAEQRWQRAWRWAGKPSIALAIILVLLAACSRTVDRNNFSPVLTLIAVLVLCAPGLGYTGWCWLRRDESTDVPPEQEYQQAQADWEQRAAGHQAAELARLAGTPEWGSVTVSPRRTDVFGGTLVGWQGLLAVHGASFIAERPLLIADLTGQYPAAPLLALAHALGIPCTAWQLPGDLGRSGLLGGLSPAQLADAVAEALHAGARDGARAERAADARVLRQIAEVLGPGGLTARRLSAAVRAALGGNAVGAGLLSGSEQAVITGSLFPPEIRQQAAPSLARLDAVLAGLAGHAGGGWPTGAARCTCLAIDAAARSASGEVLTALLIQWLTVQVTTAAMIPAVIVAGADEITRVHAERLADACELRGVPLTLLFRHLRGDATALLGGGTTAFMRLGNHQEAEHAAAFLGRQHTFIMSSYTATRGGSATATTGGSDGYGTSSGGKTGTTGASTSHNWSETRSQAEGANWSDATARQRVYEYRIDPSVLQNLPEQALLLADRAPGVLRLRAVECDPAIVTLPGVSTTPLPPHGSLQPGRMPPAMAGTNTAGTNTAGTNTAGTNTAGPALGAAGNYPAGWPAPPANYPPAGPYADDPHQPWQPDRRA